MLADLAAPPSKGGMLGALHTVALLPASRKLEPFFRNAGLSVVAAPLRNEGPLDYVHHAFMEPPLAWLSDVIRSTRADVAHLHTLGSQVLGTRAALRCGIPVLRTEHSTRAFDDMTAWPFSRWSLQRVDASVAISAHIAEAVRARAPWAEAKQHTIANGVDTEHFAYAPLPVRGIDEAFRFVLSGRLEPRKGIDLALHALALTPRAALDMVGEGPSRAALELLVAQLGLQGRASFLGHSADVRPHLAHAHAVLSSSRKEGLGLAVLEAMAMGRPAVAVPVGGLPEFVDEHTGVLVDACTSHALACGMERLMNSANMVERSHSARERVVKHYSVQAMRTQYEALYCELSARRKLHSTSS